MSDPKPDPRLTWSRTGPTSRWTAPGVPYEISFTSSAKSYQICRVRPSGLVDMTSHWFKTFNGAADGVDKLLRADHAAV